MPSKSVQWNCYLISAGSIWIGDTTNPMLGLCYGCLDDAPWFIWLPCCTSLMMMKDSRELCHAIRCCINAQTKSAHCGSSCQVFCYDLNKYICVGTQNTIVHKEVSNMDFIGSIMDSNLNIRTYCTRYSSVANKLLIPRHQHMLFNMFMRQKN